MITDPRVFADGRVPRELLHRDAAVDQVLRQVAPAADGDRAGDVFVSGPSGVGKTALVRHCLDRLERETDQRVETVYVRAMGSTTGDVLRTILRELPLVSSAAAASNRASEQVQATLTDAVRHPTIVALDEADGVPETDLLDQLAGIPLLSVVAIGHDPETWLARVADHRRAWWSGDHHVALDRYGVDELADILERRADQGLFPNAVRRDRLERIADEVAGVAREGIQALRAAAELADERRHLQVEAADVDDCFERARTRIRRLNLRSLPAHHQLLYRLVADAGEIAAGDLHDRYDDVDGDWYRGRPCEPVGPRRRREALAKLVTYDLLIATGEGRGRSYRMADDDVEPLVGLDGG
jgi:Cdc6-like AAA superfamily ATPase